MGKRGSHNLLLRSLLSLGLVAFLLWGTQWGTSLRQALQKSWISFTVGRHMSAQQKRLGVFDSTYRFLLRIRKYTPPDAVILLPPRSFIRGQSAHIPLLASASASYSFIYPRVPVHYGEGAPWRRHVTHVLNYRNWALRTFWPEAASRTDLDGAILRWTKRDTIP
jgi:hypothetical protein